MVTSEMPEWNVTPIPTSDPTDREVAERRNSTFEYAIGQLELVQRDSPEDLPHAINLNKVLWKLPTEDRKRILNYFIQAEEEPEEDTREARRKERLQDAAGKPVNEANAIVDGKRLYPRASTRPPRSKVRHYSRRGGRSFPEASDSSLDPYWNGTATEEMIQDELARAAKAVPTVDLDIEVGAGKAPEPIKFGIEPNGMVTHTRREQRSAKKLQGKDFDQGGGLRYLKVVSSYGKKSKEERLETMTKSLNHMFDYEQDAKATIESLGALIKSISKHAGSPDELLGEQSFIKEAQPIIIRALVAVAYYREAVETQVNPKRRVKGTLAERVEQTVLGDTVDNIETTAAELYFREEERLKLWGIQLRGHPADKELNIPRRFGAIDIVKDVPELAAVIDERSQQEPSDPAEQLHAS